MSHPDVKILEEGSLYKGFFSLKRYRLQYRLFSGGWSPPVVRELLTRPRVAAALPYDPVLDQVVLIEQFRIGTLAGSDRPWQIEVIAGLMEAEETPETVVHREAREEADLQVLDLIPICDYWSSPGGTDERIALFCAKVDASHAGGVHGLAKENEDILVRTMRADEAFAAVESGKINNAAAIIALQWLQLHKANVRDRFST